MKKILKKVVAAILVLTMVLSFAPTCFATGGKDVRTECGGECEYAPSIIIPGLFQSPNRLYNDDGSAVLDKDGNPIKRFLIDLDTGDIIRIVFKAIIPLVLSLVFQYDIGLSKTTASIVADDILGNNATGTDGKHIKNVDVVRYTSSLKECDSDGKRHIYGEVPIESYVNIAGEDHLYFFSYDSFGSISEITDELYAFIQNVKKETGHDKVNIVPISQAGTISNALFDRYTEEMARDLNRVVYIIPALDGSWLITKIFNGEFIRDDEMLYRDMLPHLFEEDEPGVGYLANIALRLLSKDMLNSVLDRVLSELVDKLIVNSSCMWALVSECDYEELHDKYLKSGEREAVRKEAEFYHEARADRIENIKILQEAGVRFFDIADYDYTFYPLFPGWDKTNADGIIQLDSTSLGAVSAPVGESLPKNYKEAGTYCTCTDGHSHMSPDGTVDASTGFLCETTFYFKGQDHQGTGRNDVIMRLAIDILTDENFKNVHSYPDKYPQFNEGRETKWLRSKLSGAKKIDLSTLSKEDAEELSAAVAECEEMLAETVVDAKKAKAAETRFVNIMIKIGAEEEEVSDARLGFAAFLKKLSELTYKYIGPRGFSDVFRFKHRAW